MKKLTYKDLEERQQKAEAFDQALAYLEGHANNEDGFTALEILRRGIADE